VIHRVLLVLGQQQIIVYRVSPTNTYTQVNVLIRHNYLPLLFALQKRLWVAAQVKCTINARIATYPVQVALTRLIVQYASMAISKLTHHLLQVFVDQTVIQPSILILGKEYV
jgi:hypothetical protein